MKKQYKLKEQNVLKLKIYYSEVKNNESKTNNKNNNSPFKK